ncbi:LytTR family DNA-binding domain-containing protein [Dyadobacter sp. LHD-138]|uniref:LytR/AlgR family response regulator transcription factor n=1 Tax=Dyadobacter sp. LHD-138 TaxID=3071413 RepID=UPI0027DF4315|nr:LytTR family DNA-binding domain-containing protein [Dyadobacter sp. LHD-138]MDQ6480737.1 LytTR family DNA-binding domain-containing protein [Dyadobacter sp. LHD-138]
MVKALIVDDELKARNVLNHYIANFIPEITEVQQADSADAALAILKTYQPGIVFLDVEMPHKNGFDFLLSLNDPAFEIIFTTAYNQYAIQAIRFSALDYLLKPVDPDELKAAMVRYLDKQKPAKQKKELFDNLIQNIGKKEVKDFRLAVPSSQGMFFFTLDEILRLEADRNYTVIHLVGKRPFVASKTLKHFEEMLDEFNFIRTHKSHLVNSMHIVRLSNDHESVLLSDGARIEISRRKKDEVQQQLSFR